MTAERAYLSLGSNIGEREKYLRDAIRRLGAMGRVVAVSSLYETEPADFTKQAWFLNSAAILETKLTSVELMVAILRIEQAMARHRTVPKGPRTIDIDILLFGNLVVNSPELTIPHPAMTQRRFVLEPLAEIAPKVRHPALNKNISELLNELPGKQAVIRVAAGLVWLTEG